MPRYTKRETRGMELLCMQGVELKPFGWSVASSNPERRYVVTPNIGAHPESDTLSPRQRRYGLWCSCPDYQIVGNRCKHIAAVYFWQQLNNYPEEVL